MWSRASAVCVRPLSLRACVRACVRACMRAGPLHLGDLSQDGAGGNTFSNCSSARLRVLRPRRRPLRRPHQHDPDQLRAALLKLVVRAGRLLPEQLQRPRVGFRPLLRAARPQQLVRARRWLRRRHLTRCGTPRAPILARPSSHAHLARLSPHLAHPRSPSLALAHPRTIAHDPHLRLPLPLPARAHRRTGARLLRRLLPFASSSTSTSSSPSPSMPMAYAEENQQQRSGAPGEGATPAAAPR